jgi:hypothetical protein
MPQIMPTDNEIAYRLQATQVLGSFQMLEFALKLYLATSYKIINHKLNGCTPFYYSIKDVENCPLEKLLNLFKKHNSNVLLQSQLNKLRQSRNHLAHQALIYSHEEIRDLHEISLSESHQEIANVRAEIDKCLKLITIELETIYAIADSIGA